MNTRSPEHTFMYFDSNEVVVSENCRWEYRIYLEIGETYRQVYPWVRRFNRHIHFSSHENAGAGQCENNKPSPKCAHFNDINYELIRKHYIEIMDAMCQQRLEARWAGFDFIIVGDAMHTFIIINLIYSLEFTVSSRPYIHQEWASLQMNATRYYRSIHASSHPRSGPQQLHM